MVYGGVFSYVGYFVWETKLTPGGMLHLFHPRRYKCSYDSLTFGTGIGGYFVLDRKLDHQPTLGIGWEPVLYPIDFLDPGQGGIRTNCRTPTDALFPLGFHIRKPKTSVTCPKIEVTTSDIASDTQVAYQWCFPRSSGVFTSWNSCDIDKWRQVTFSSRDFLSFCVHFRCLRPVFGLFSSFFLIPMGQSNHWQPMATQTKPNQTKRDH